MPLREGIGETRAVDGCRYAAVVAGWGICTRDCRPELSWAWLGVLRRGALARHTRRSANRGPLALKFLPWAMASYHQRGLQFGPLRHVHVPAFGLCPTVTSPMP